MNIFLFYDCSYFSVNHILYMQLSHNGTYYETTDYFFYYNVIYLIPSHDVLDNSNKLRDERAFYFTLALCFLVSMASSSYNFISVCTCCSQINTKTNVYNDINNDYLHQQSIMLNHTDLNVCYYRVQIFSYIFTRVEHALIAEKRKLQRLAI